MPRKGKKQVHTAKELKAKAAAATTNKGGGKAGVKDRKGGKAGHSKFKCPICSLQAPSLKNMEMHWDSKHGKLPWDPTQFENTHKTVGSTVQGVGVKGGKRTKAKAAETKSNK